MTTPTGGEAAGGWEAVRLAADRVPDVVDLDPGLPGASGLEAVRTIKEHLPTTWMLVVSAHAGAEHVLGLLETGADGYLLKRSLPAALRAAVHRAAAGERVLDPEPVRVVPAWATGKELAAALGLSPKTVTSQRGRILVKLGAVNSAAAVRSAVAQVLLAAPLGRIGGDRTFAAD